MKRTRTNEATEAALAEVCEKLEIGMQAQKKNNACAIFAALLEMHGLWRSGPFKVDDERETRGEA